MGDERGRWRGEDQEMGESNLTSSQERWDDDAAFSVRLSNGRRLVPCSAGQNDRRESERTAGNERERLDLTRRQSPVEILSTDPRLGNGRQMKARR